MTLIIAAYFLLLSTFAVFITLTQEESLKITVYYETYCPDSIEFIEKQLAPMLGEFNQYPDWLVLDLIPFGKAQKSGKGYKCQHGTKECQGNKMNACLIDQLVTQHSWAPLNLRLMNFLYCVMREADQIKAAKKCAPRTQVNYKELMKCYNGKKGDELIDIYANRTAALQPPLSWVPTVVFNDVFNITQSDLAQTDLYSLVCSLVPEECE